MTDQVLIDTGPLVAILRRNDQWHDRCVIALKSLPRPLLTCWPVLTEAFYLLKTKATDADAARLLEMVDGNLLSLLPLNEEDAPGIQAILTQYADQQLDLADATLMWLATREDVSTVFTLDRKDFAIYIPPNENPLKLIP